MSANARAALKDELDTANEEIINIEQTLYESKNVQNQMVEQMKELEERNLILEEQNKHWKGLADNAKNLIYCARHDDDTDRKLGNFVNTFPEREKLKILFLRESEGVYRFG